MSKIKNKVILPTQPTKKSTIVLTNIHIWIRFSFQPLLQTIAKDSY